MTARGGRSLYAWADDLSFSIVPARPRAVCGAVHPDRYRMAVCDLDDGHDGYHKTEDGRTEWQTADVSRTGGISCVTIDRAAGAQVLRCDPPAPFAGAAPAGNRRARRAARKGKRR